MGKNYITAVEAKNLNKTTDKLISMVFKAIKTEAEYGFSELFYSTDRVALVAFNNLIDKLTEAGFKLSFYYPDCSEKPDSFVVNLVEGRVPAGLKICW